MLYQDKIREIENDLLPFGFIDDNKQGPVRNETHDKLVAQQKNWLEF